MTRGLVLYEDLRYINIYLVHSMGSRLGMFSQGDLHKWRPLLPWFFADSKLKEISKNLNNNIKTSTKVMVNSEFEGCGLKIRPAKPICILNSKWLYLAWFWSYKKVQKIIFHEKIISARVLFINICSCLNRFWVIVKNAIFSWYHRTLNVQIVR